MNELSFGDEEVCKVGECILCVFAVLGVFALKPSLQWTTFAQRRQGQQRRKEHQIKLSLILCRYERKIGVVFAAPNEPVEDVVHKLRKRQQRH